ncbi:hypothetical protein [Streptomyces roseolilacinus]|uniref:hypothetical protein n=1 Tax=Streptomyces roseolilacinus TaxID=66904 RepID=UPI0037F746F8
MEQSKAPAWTTGVRRIASRRAEAATGHRGARAAGRSDARRWADADTGASACHRARSARTARGGPTGGRASPGRTLGEIAALISALAAVAGVLLGFSGLPTVVDSPTARTVTAAATTTTTVTVTAPAPTGPGDDGEAKPSSPAPLPSGTAPLTDLPAIGGGDAFPVQSVTMGTKSYEHAMTPAYPCDNTSVEYRINERYRSLTLTVGPDDNSKAELIEVTIHGDDRLRDTVGARINRPQTVTVDMTGVVRLRISSTGECGSDGLVLALADATLRS